MNEPVQAAPVSATDRYKALGPWCLGLALLMAALLLAVLGEARAADDADLGLVRDLAAMDEAARDAPDAGRGFRVEAGGGFTSPAEVGKARMAVWREEGRVFYETGSLALDAGFAAGQYDFSRVGRLPFGGRAPFSHLALADGGLTLRGGLWRDVSGFVGLRGDMGFEDRPDLRGLGGTVLAGLVVPLGQSFALTLGGGVSVTPVDVVPVPVVGLHYESPAATGLTVDVGLPRTEAAWRGGSWWAVRLTGEVESGHYRLAKDNPAAPEGTASLLSAKAGLWLDLTPVHGLKASLGAHYALPGTLTFYRESGSQLKKYDTGGAPGASVRLGWSF
jgi:hypothetical protein